MEGTLVQLLVDTGAQHSVLVKPHGKVSEKSSWVQGATGIKKYPWTTQRTVDLGTGKVTHSFLVIPDSPCPLLGRDLLTKMGAQIHFQPGDRQRGAGAGPRLGPRTHGHGTGRGGGHGRTRCGHRLGQGGETNGAPDPQPPPPTTAHGTARHGAPQSPPETRAAIPKTACGTRDLPPRDRGGGRGPQARALLALPFSRGRRPACLSLSPPNTFPPQPPPHTTAPRAPAPSPPRPTPSPRPTHTPPPSGPGGARRGRGGGGLREAAGTGHTGPGRGRGGGGGGGRREGGSGGHRRLHLGGRRAQRPGRPSPRPADDPAHRTAAQAGVAGRPRAGRTPAGRALRGNPQPRLTPGRDTHPGEAIDRQATLRQA